MDETSKNREFRRVKEKTNKVYDRVFLANGKKPLTQEVEENRNGLLEMRKAHEKTDTDVKTLDNRVQPIESWITTSEKMAKRGWDLSKILISNVLMLVLNLVFLILNALVL